MRFSTRTAIATSVARRQSWGTDGSATLIGGSFRIATLDGDVQVIEVEGGTGGGANIVDFPHDAHRAVLEDFVEAVTTDRDPAVTGEDALASQHLVDQVLARAAEMPDRASG